MTTFMRFLALVLAVGFVTEVANASAPGEGSFRYELYCDEQGRFTYDGAALSLARQPSHLQRVYADATQGLPRAKELVRELELAFQEVGVALANMATAPQCMVVPELTPGCMHNWSSLNEFGKSPEAERLKKVLRDAYDVQVEKRRRENKVIAATVNLAMAGALAKGVMAKAAAADARAMEQALISTGEVINIDPAKLRWSQTTAGGRGRADALRVSMREHGWSGGPIDVVATPEGLVTVDHTRAAVALELGLPSIPARVHLPTDPLPAEMLSREWNSLGQKATTWGEAVALRGAGQIPPTAPTGTPVPPRLPKPGER